MRVNLDSDETGGGGGLRSWAQGEVELAQHEGGPGGVVGAALPTASRKVSHFVEGPKVLSWPGHSQPTPRDLHPSDPPPSSCPLVKNHNNQPLFFEGLLCARQWRSSYRCYFILRLTLKSRNR